MVGDIPKIGEEGMLLIVYYWVFFDCDYNRWGFIRYGENTKNASQTNLVKAIHW